MTCQYLVRDRLTRTEDEVVAPSTTVARCIGSRRLDCPEADVEVEKA